MFRRTNWAKTSQRYTSLITLHQWNILVSQVCWYWNDNERDKLPPWLAVSNDFPYLLIIHVWLSCTRSYWEGAKLIKKMLYSFSTIMMNESNLKSQVKSIAISSAKMTTDNRFPDLTVQSANRLIQLIPWIMNFIDGLLQIENSTKLLHHTQ